jgi:hypothetical protein
VPLKSASFAAVALLALSPAIGTADIPDDNVDLFYSYITGVAQLAGYDTSTLPQNPPAAYKQAVDAYFWGFPLQTTYRTQLSFLNSHGLDVNTLYAPGVIDTSTTVEAPDVDVLYTSGFLDVSGTNAFVLQIPNTTATSTYNVMEVVNAYGDTTITVGTRNFTTSAVNNSGGAYLVVGPGYDTAQPLPSGVISYIQSETAQCWLIGRVAVDGAATATLSNGDPTPYNLAAGGAANPLSANHSIPYAQSYSVTTLSDYLLGQTTPAITSSTPTPEEEAIAEANAATKTGQAFFEYVGASVAQNGAPSTPDNDQYAMYQNFAPLGLTLSGYTAPDAPTVQTMDQAATDAAAMLETMALNTGALPGGGATATGWTVNTTLGDYPATYEGWLTNALTAYIGTVANLAADGTYPQTTVDSTGQPLDGANRYTITFPAGQLPPVQGFWSFTIYNLAGFVTPNTGNTYYGDNVYSLGSMQMANVLGASLDTTPITFYLQSTPPSDPALMPYWLPVPNEAFEIILRMYFPSSTNPSILDGTYAIPPVVRVAAPAVVTGVAISGSKTKTRATFTIRNTGNTTATFNLHQTRKLSGAGMNPGSGNHHQGGSAPLIKLATTLDGKNITSALEKHRASITLAPGGSVKAVTKISLRRPLAVRRQLRLGLQATGTITPPAKATRILTFTFQP